MNNSSNQIHDNWSLDETSRVIITVIFGSIIFVGVLGNVLVIFLIVLVKKLHSTVNLCLGCLAVADLIVLVFLPIMPFLGLYSKDQFSLGVNFCVFVNSIDRGPVVCSTLMFLLVGVERYTVLCHPLQSLGWWTYKKVCLLLVVIFVISVGVCVPYGFATAYEEVFYFNSSRTYCDMKWDVQWFLHYETVVNIVSFFIPIPVLFLLYGKMIISLNKKVPYRDEQRGGERGTSKSRSKIVVMLVVVIVVFIICELPIKIYMFLYMYDPHALVLMGDKSSIAIVWFTRIIAYINHASNPVVNFLMSGKFREAFKDVFCGRCRIRKPNSIRMVPSL